MGPTKKRNKPPRLSASDLLASDEKQQTAQVAEARSAFIEAVHRLVPAFFERLRDHVFPEFSRLSDATPGYWGAGWTFGTWRLHSDRLNILTPVLTDWAREFNVQGETWILEGALQTLWNWKRSPALKAKMDPGGFTPRFAFASVITDDDEHHFRFEDEGVDPTFLTFEYWRIHVRKRFEEALDAYEKQLSERIKGRGAVNASSRFSPEHFEWLALFHCGNSSLAAILSRSRMIADKTAISRGIHTAAKLAKISVRSSRRRLRP
jgi:hypothetical protein